MVVTQSSWTHPNVDLPWLRSGREKSQEQINKEWHDILTQVESDPCPGCGFKPRPDERDYYNHHPDCPVRRYGDNWQAEVKKADRAEARRAKKAVELSAQGLTVEAIIKRFWPHARPEDRSNWQRLIYKVEHWLEGQKTTGS